MRSTAEQKASLERLLKVATSPTPGHCNYGAMVYLEPLGDVSFLAPIAPELRGIEIVSASPRRDDGRNYDIWKRGRHSGLPGKLLMSDLTVVEVIGWLQAQCHHTESEYFANAAQWLEDVLVFYGIPRRGAK